MTSFSDRKDYLIWSIISTVLCCFCGIPAIIASTKAKESYKFGRVAEAQQYALKAQSWNIIATIFYLIYLLILYFIVKQATSI